MLFDDDRHGIAAGIIAAPAGAVSTKPVAGIPSAQPMNGVTIGSAAPPPPPMVSCMPSFAQSVNQTFCLSVLLVLLLLCSCIILIRLLPWAFQW